MEAGKAFEARASQALTVGRDGASYTHPIPLEELEPILHAAEQLGLQVGRPGCLPWVEHALLVPERPKGLPRAACVAPALGSAAAPLNAFRPSTHFAPRAPPPPPLQLDSLPVLQHALRGFKQWEEGMRAITQVSDAWNGHLLSFFLFAFPGSTSQARSLPTPRPSRLPPPCPPPPPPAPAPQDAKGKPLRPSFAALQEASQSARAWPVTSCLRAFADEAVTKTGARELALAVCTVGSLS